MLALDDSVQQTLQCSCAYMAWRCLGRHFRSKAYPTLHGVEMALLAGVVEALCLELLLGPLDSLHCFLSASDGPGPICALGSQMVA